MIPMTDEMRKEIVERSATLIAKASAPKALLSMRDIEALTGFAYYGKTLQGMLREKSFPRPVVVGTREKRWFAGEVFRWLEKQREIQTT